MTDNLFDKNIKDVLQSHLVDSSAADWALMNNRLEQEGLSQSDTVNEQIIADKVSNFKVDFNNKDWTTFYEKMILFHALRTKIISTKISELVFIFFLLLAVIQLTNYQKTSNYSPSIVINKSNTESSVLLDQQNDLLLALYDLNKVNNTAAYSIIETNYIASIDDVELMPLPISSKPLTKPSRRIDINRGQEGIQEIAFIDPSLLGKTSFIPISLFSTLKPSIPTHKFMEFGISGDINLINTPIDPVFFKDPVSTGAIGATAFLGYSSMKQSNEFGIQLRYSYKTYNPRIVEKITDQFSNSVTKSFERVDYHIFSIPIFYRRHLKITENTNIYANLGMAFDFVGFTDYTVRNRSKSRFPAPSFVKSNSALDKKDFHKGLLQNGSLLKNSFASTYIGIGFNHQLSIRWNIFLQSNYEYHLFSQHIGPNNDKLNAFSFILGSKMRFN